MEIQNLLQQSPVLFALAGVVLLAILFVGRLLGRRGQTGLRVKADDTSRALARAEAQVKEQQRAVARMKDELDTVASLAMSLPHVVRDLNRDDLELREVPGLIIQLAQSIFQPQQVLFYAVRQRPGGQNSTPELYLQAAQGIGEPPMALRTVAFGTGKIGWVADHELDMLRDDWETLTRTEGLTVPDNHPGVRADIVGPLLHHTRESQSLLGVLCLGGPRIRPRDEKLMFQLVTNLGSLALVNSRNISQLKLMANHDGLTGLYNKRYFTTTLVPAQIVACEKQAQPLSLFIFDIDHFKNYNDTNGHPAGDELLRNMGRLIRRSLRPGDLACRYGGEEFVVVMPETDRELGFELADKLRQTIASTTMPFGDKQPLGSITISGGVATFPKDATSLKDLIGHADESLYTSKKGGRNRVTMYKGIEIGDYSDDVTLQYQRAEALAEGDDSSAA